MFDDETIYTLTLVDPREVYGFNAPSTEPPEEDEDVDFGYEDDEIWDYEEDDEEEKGDKF